MPLLHATNSATHDLTMGGTLITHTMSEHGRVGVSVMLAPLDESATLTLTLETLDGSNNSCGSIVESVIFPTGLSRFRLQSEHTLFIPSGHKLKVMLESTGNMNTQVNCAVYLFDPHCGSDLVGLGGEDFDSYVGQNFNVLFNNNDTLAGTALDDISTFDAATSTVKVDDFYHADINVAIDGVAPLDEYTVTWFKNGARLTSGISSPTIQVVKRVDGEPLVPSASMSPIGSTGTYKKDEGTNLISAGEAVLVIVSATIDSATRTFSKVVSRDAAAA